MRLVMRSQVRAATVSAATACPVSAERRAWIEALFGEHLPRSGEGREQAIETLAGDHSVWRLLHQVRHSMAETSATIERLASAALTAQAPRAA